MSAEPAQDTVPGRASPRWSRARWLVVAIMGGCVTGLGFEPFHLWPLVPVGVAAMVVAARSLRPGFGLLSGYLYGFALLFVEAHWIGPATSWAVLAAMSAWMGVWWAVVGLSLSLTRHRASGLLLGVGVWMAGEWASSRWPFGGFGWARLAYTGVGTPIDGLYPIISATGVSLMIAATGFALAYAWTLWRLRPAITITAVAPLAIILVLSALGPLGKLYDPPADNETLAVAIVQGNVPGGGADALGPLFTVENNHLSETILLSAKVRTGQVDQPDFVVWPENSTATNPYTIARTNTIVTTAVDIMGTPILVGAIVGAQDNQYRQTVGIWWDKTGPGDTYAKRNLVPFGEWIPARDLLLKVFPILDKTGRQSLPGTKPGVLDVSTDSGPLRLGDIICFEVAYDDTVDEALTGDTTTGGAQLLVVQTSNAMFTGTDQMVQQDAITRLRAMESRREILVSTTNSLAGFIDAQGHIVYQSAPRTADSAVFTVPLRSNLTPAIRYRGLIDALAAGVPLAAWILCFAVGRSRWKNRTIPTVRSDS